MVDKWAGSIEIIPHYQLQNEISCFETALAGLGL